MPEGKSFEQLKINVYLKIMFKTKLVSNSESPNT